MQQQFDIDGKAQCLEVLGLRGVYNNLATKLASGGSQSTLCKYDPVEQKPVMRFCWHQLLQGVKKRCSVAI